jgi:hypothetical protein
MRWVVVKIGEVDERRWSASGIDEWWGRWGGGSKEEREETEERKRRSGLTIRFRSTAKEEKQDARRGVVGEAKLGGDLPHQTDRPFISPWRLRFLWAYEIFFSSSSY